MRARNDSARSTASSKQVDFIDKDFTWWPRYKQYILRRKLFTDKRRVYGQRFFNEKIALFFLLLSTQKPHTTADDYTAALWHIRGREPVYSPTINSIPNRSTTLDSDFYTTPVALTNGFVFYTF